MKTLLIFGHTSGLGLALSMKYLSEGYSVVGVSRRRSEVESSNLTNIQADLSEEADIHRVTKEIRETHGRFEALLYCAGVLTSHAIDQLSFEQMEYMYKVNNFAPMVIESNLLSLIKSNSADVLNVTSDSAFNFYENYYEYSGSKLSLQKFTNDLQKTLKNTPCRVMDFCTAGFQSNIRKVATGQKVMRDESTYMRAEDLADLIYSMLNLPKRIEVGLIVLNRKANI